MVHWVHAIAAVAWVGGSIFYLVVLRPALAGAALADRALELAINRGFKDVVDLSIIALLVTGVFITFDRLSSAPATSLYYIVLALKLTTVITMFFMARQLGTRTGRLLRSRSALVSAAQAPAAGGVPLPSPLPSSSPLRQGGGRGLGPSNPPSFLRRWLAPPRLVLVLGLVAFFLSMVLARVYERNLGSIA